MSAVLQPGSVPGAPGSERSGPLTSREPVLSMARYEAGRLARHPLFIVGVLLFVGLTLTTPFSEYANAEYDTTNNTETNLDWPVLPAFALGLFGLIAMNRLATGSDRSGDVLEAVPLDQARRTLALCLAAVVPMLLALAGSAFVFWFWMTDPPVNSVSWGEFTTSELVAIMAGGVLAAAGGPLLGVLVARWWRWPGAAAITSVLLVLWSTASILLRDTVALLTLNHMASPFTLVASNYESSSWHLGGSYEWRVLYLAGLCVLAGLGACAHGTTGRQRRILARWSIAIGVLTVAALLLSAFVDPVGYPGHWQERWG